MQLTVGVRVCCRDAPRNSVQAVTDSQDALGCGIQLQHPITRADDHDSMPNQLQRLGKIAAAITQGGKPVLDAQRLLQVRDQPAHQPHPISGVERIGSFRCRHDNVNWSRSGGEPDE